MDLELGVVLLWGQVVVDLCILTVVSISSTHLYYCSTHRLLLKNKPMFHVYSEIICKRKFLLRGI